MTIRHHQLTQFAFSLSLPSVSQHLRLTPRSSMAHGKQFTLYTHKGGPNGWYAR